MKRSILNFMLFLLLGVMGMTKAFAQTQVGSEFYNNGLKYKVTNMSSPSVTLIGYENAPTGTLTINQPVEWDNKTWNITAIGSEAFKGCTGITAVVIVSNVETIGSNAFENCTGLTSVNTQNVKTINSEAFKGCTALTNVNMDENFTTLQSIGGNAFEGCTKLSTISLPSKLTSIGSWAFYGCTGLTTVTIKNAAAAIGSCAFFDCGELTTVNLGNALTSIGELAFSKCTKLTSITLPNSLTTIDKQAFKNSGLTSVNIPASVTSIGSMAFASCPDLKAITVDGNNSTYDSRSNCNAIIETNTNTLIMACHSTTVIPEGVKAVKASAFYECNPTSVTIPSSMTAIGEDAFDHCGMTTITIPSSVQSIGSSAFENCEKLTSVTIPNGVPAIEPYTFSNCLELSSVTIPNSITSIGHDAFVSCYALTSITIPNSVTTIGNYAFHYAGLTSIVIPNSVTTVGKYAFMDCTSLTSAVLSNSMKVIEERAFAICTKLGSVTIPNSVERIEESAFSQTDLTSLVIPNSVTYIGKSAFYHCVKLQDVVMGNSVAEIASAAFWDCFYLKKITILASQVPQLDHVDAFAWVNSYNNSDCCDFYVPAHLVEAYKSANNWNLPKYQNHMRSLDDQNITFDDANVKTLCMAQEGWDANNDGELSYAEAAAVTNIGTGFKGNTTIASFNELQYFTKVTSLDAEAFSGCTSLTSVELPKSMMTIGSKAFKGCTKLAGVAIPNAVTTIGSFAFDGCTSIETVNIGSAVTSIDDYAFSGCSKLLSITLQPTAVPTLTATGSETHVFDNTNECPIYVPNEKVSDYKSAWSKYAHRIKPMDPTNEAPVEDAVDVTLNDNASNEETLTTYDEKLANITLSGRTLYKDGSWNTICLPFALSAKQLDDKDCPLNDATIKELEDCSFANGTLTLKFTENSLSAIEAGKPYLVKLPEGTDVTNPVFKNVTVAKEVRATTIIKDQKYGITFTGSYNPTEITSDMVSQKTILYLGASNKLYYPNAVMTIGACRAIFQLQGLTAGEPATANGVRSFMMNLGDDDVTTGIRFLSGSPEGESTEAFSREGLDGVWYSLDGRKLNGKPTKRGLYINNGKKVIVREKQ